MFDFLGLPRELRDHIYDYVLVHEGAPAPLVVCKRNTTALPRIIDARTSATFYHAKLVSDVRLPSYAFRATCRMVECEFNEAIGRRVVLSVVVLAHKLDQDRLAQIQRVPPPLDHLIKRMELYIVFPTECPRLDWSWLSSVLSLETLSVSVVVTETRKIRPDRDCYALRGLIGDMYANVPASATVLWENPVASAVKMNRKLVHIDRAELEAVASQTRGLHGRDLPT